MTAFTAQVFQNQYLTQGSDQVHAVMSVSSALAAGASGKELVEAFLIDCSGSMDGDKIRAARGALAKAIDLLRDDAWFCVVAGTGVAQVAFPLAQATPENKRRAADAVKGLKADGGTAMSTWLRVAREQFRKKPGAIHHALLLTDGRNEGEPEQKLTTALHECEGEFQCDARGIGTDWVPDQLRLISAKLLGTVDIIPQPADMEADFRKVLQAALGKAVRDVFLRLWTPAGAQVEFCKQVFPEKTDLTGRARTDAKNPQLREYPTGSWGAEKRDYHLSIRVVPGQVGQRMLAGRASLVVVEDGKENVVSEAKVLAVWTDDETQSAVIHPAVAHYTGQAELADAIQQGLKARASGDEKTATSLLGRAVQIAAASNPDTMLLLKKVVEVEDERTGTVRLRKDVNKADEFALDTRSTRTARVAKS